MVVSRSIIVIDSDEEAGDVIVDCVGDDDSRAFEYAKQIAEIMASDAAYRAAMLVLVSEGKAIHHIENGESDAG